MVKKVVVAAAGKGTRMLHLSKDKPKHLIEVNGRPFLSYVLDNLFLAGYEEIMLVAGYKKELVENFLKEYNSDGKNVLLADQGEGFDQEKDYGTACPLMLKKVRDFVGKDQFIFVFGDNLFSVSDLGILNIDDDFCYITGLKQKHSEKYGVLVGENYLEKIVEKPASPSQGGPKEYIGNLVNAGLYKFTPEIFKEISEIKKSPRGEYEITDAISALAKEKKVKIKEINKPWHDFGSPDDIEKVSKYLSSKNV